MRTNLLGVLAVSSALVFACSSTTQSSGGGGDGTTNGVEPGTDAGHHVAPPVPTAMDAGYVAPPPTGLADASTDCSASAKPGSLDAINVTTLTSEVTVPMCIYKGKVLLVVNTASMCGYTPQYTPLQAIYAKYVSQGFLVLGFPSQSFNQEFSDGKDVSSFCTTNYGITFPMFKIANVNAPDEQPLYTWLKAQPNSGTADVAWNFEKFIIGKKGDVVQRFLTGTTPDDASVTAVIEAELAKQ